MIVVDILEICKLCNGREGIGVIYFQQWVKVKDGEEECDERRGVKRG